MKIDTTVECPDCGEEVSLREDILQAEIVVCPQCATELEVVAVDPVVLALAPDVEEDWGE